MKILLMVVIAYLLGSIPSGVWVGKIFYHRDIRLVGSGNIGTTNTFRVLGPVAGTVVLFMDMFKGTLAASLPLLMHSNINPLLIGLVASLGHTVSIFNHFHGGKAVATSCGILLAYDPLLFLIAWLIFGSTMYLTSMASMASMVGITGMFIVSLFKGDPILILVAGILMVVVIYRHLGNIKRIKNKTEPLVHFGLAYKRSLKK